MHYHLQKEGEMRLSIGEYNFPQEFLRILEREEFHNLSCFQVSIDALKQGFPDGLDWMWREVKESIFLFEFGKKTPQRGENRQGDNSMTDFTDWAKKRIGQVIETRGGWVVRIIAIEKDRVVGRLSGCCYSLTKIFWDTKGREIMGQTAFDIP